MKRRAKILITDKFLMFILILSGCFQNIEIMNISQGFGLKLYHVVSILLIGRLIIKTKGKIKLLPTIINLFFILILMISFIAYIFYGFNSLCINYIFDYYLMILIINIGKEINYDEWVNIFKKIAIIVLVLTYINILLNFSQVKFFLTGNTERVILNTFFGGGINLEATWIAMLGVFFLKNNKVYIYLFFSMVISMLYSSRAGIIVNVLFFLIVLIQNNRKKNEKMKKIFLITVLCGILFFINIKTGMFSYILKRFSNLGNENGSLGRLNMWKYVLPTLCKNPFGYGLGNAISAISKVSGNTYTETNLHNMFLQMAVDTGIIGFMAYLFINMKFLVKEIKKINKNSIVAFMILYIMLSFIEFRGADFLIYTMVAIYCITKYNNLEKKDGL